MAKILIVEDERPVAENLQALLAAKGHEVALAFDGPEGLAAARANPPQAMLLDIMLPKMGGFDVCRILKTQSETKKIKIIMITGLGRMGDVETAFQNGADDYIIKPFDSERLFKKLDKVLAPGK
ncbi:MAG: response regulator [Elusimicrobia bacterium]|nr:response regulator [Elusimicrobiota bacterium]